MTGPAVMPSAVQEHGVPFDVFIQALTLQLDKAQAAMAVKARVARLPLTFAVKDVSLDLRAFVRIINDEMWVRPSGPGDAGASTIRLELTTVTKPMIDENAVGFHAEEPKFSLREALGDHISEEDQRRLEMIGVQTVQQLQDLRSAAGADVVARLARMPVNRLQQAMLAAGAPRVTAVSPVSAVSPAAPSPIAHVSVQTPAMRPGRLPQVHVQGEPVDVIHHDGEHLVLAPRVTQLGQDAVLDYGQGDAATVRLAVGSLGRWHDKAGEGHEGDPS